MKKTIKQTAFSFQWKPLAQPVVPKGEFYPLRDWQKKAFRKLKKSIHSIINAPMGSGKTWLMCLLSAYKMQKHSNLKTLIAVPQTIIGNGFSEAKFLMPDDSKLHWFAQHNLCQESPNEGTIQYVIDWLQNTPAFFQDRILICTHATIVAVYKRLKDTNQRKLLHDLICWIDEAHHLKNAEIEGFEDSIVSNGIGEFAAYLLQYGKNVHLGLSTASFFRGDRLNLLTPKMRDKFVRFDLPYDEYMESMQYLKSFSFDFLLCGPDYLKAVSEVTKDKHKDIIYIPHPASRHSTGDKYSEVEQIVECYRKTHKGKEIDLDNGLTVLRKKYGEFKILDLVDEDRRKAKKSYVCEIEKRDDLDAIIALGMFKEGANWIWADRSIIVGPRASLVDVIQMVGRLLRDAEGKEHVQVVQLLPFSIDQTDEKKFRENLNNYLKAILASLVLEDIFNPVKIKVPKGKKKKGTKHEKIDWLSEVLPDAEKQIALREDVRDKLMEIAILNNAEGDVTFLWEEYQKVLPEILSEYGVISHIKEVGQQIWAGFARRTLQMRGVDISDVDFNILKDVDPLGYILRYASSCVNSKCLSDIRNLVSTRKTVREWVTIAEHLSREHGGHLPSQIWMQQHGYSSLCFHKRQHPEMFSHIPSYPYETRTISDWVQYAEEIAQNEYEGKLPLQSQLRKEHPAGLVAVMRNNPDSFSHIPQDIYVSRSEDEWLDIITKLANNNGGVVPNSNTLKELGYGAAHNHLLHNPKFAHFNWDRPVRNALTKALQKAEKLAKKNNGILPCVSWLQSNGYSNIVNQKRRNPEEFQHIPQENKKAEWAKERQLAVKEAEELATEHGKLPNVNWLKRNNKRHIIKHRQSDPAAFEHIKQDPTFRTSDDWLVEAENIAQENDGRLPPYPELEKMGFSGLIRAISLDREKFQHLLVKRTKIPEDWVKIAEELAEEHGGCLPNNGWLQKNGYVGLYKSKTKKPELFCHVKQTQIQKRTIADWLDVAQSLHAEFGHIPKREILKIMGYAQLQNVMRNNPKEFAKFRGVRN